jgi:hypothetical protein
MANAKADLIRLLEMELDILESGGYQNPAGQPGEQPPLFYHSPACINHWVVPDHEHECHEDCILLPAVPEEHRKEALPCHFIPLNERGETIRLLQSEAGRERAEEAVKDWLKSTIRRLKEGEEALGQQDVKY